MMAILLTGSAGFIGFHVAQKLLSEGFEVIGIDNLNPYYDVALKKARNDVLLKNNNYLFKKVSIENRVELESLFSQQSFQGVIHLAAQPGVRYSFENPAAYVDSNLVGFTNMLEVSKLANLSHFVFASSSSVYGANTKMPFSTGDSVDHPLSLYAATKKANELLAHAYSNMYKLPVTGLRFFTVYGPWGRPDMAIFKFTKAIIEGRSIDVYNNGNMRRDFTYISDIATGVVEAYKKPALADSAWSSDRPNPASSFLPYRIFNIGNNRPENLVCLIELLEAEIGRKAVLNMMPMQLGDVCETYADVDPLYEAVNFKPCTALVDGVHSFVSWYKSYYNC